MTEEDVVLGQRLAMIGREYHQGVALESQLLQPVEQTLEMVIEIGDFRVVARDIVIDIRRAALQPDEGPDAAHRFSAQSDLNPGITSIEGVVDEPFRPW